MTVSLNLPAELNACTCVGVYSLDAIEAPQCSYPVHRESAVAVYVVRAFFDLCCVRAVCSSSGSSLLKSAEQVLQHGPRRAS